MTTKRITDADLKWVGLTSSQVALCAEEDDDVREIVYYEALKLLMEEGTSREPLDFWDSVTRKNVKDLELDLGHQPK